MDTQIEITEKVPLSDNVTSQNERQFFTKSITMKTKTDAVLLDNNSDVIIKKEIKSEPPFPYFCSQKEREYYTMHPVQHNRFETVICGNNYVKAEIGSQNGEEFLPEHPVTKDKTYDSDHETHDKMEVKVEPWWLQEDSSSVSDDIKDEDFSEVKSPRLCTEAVYSDSSGDSPWPSAAASGKNTSFGYVRECESQESYVIKAPPIEICIPAEQPVKFGGQRKRYKRLIRKDNKTHKCQICEKKFTRLSHLKLHNLIHEGKKPHKCQICGKSFTQISALNRHNSIHEGYKPHKCEVCHKGFIQMSSLRLHHLIHEGVKPHKCKVCEKSFTLLSHLKRHNLIHEGIKPHQCLICERRFTQWSALNRHSLTHEGEKPHKCEICEKRFTVLSQLKRHIVIHQDKKPFNCEICEKSFTQLSSLKRHKFLHEGERANFGVNFGLPPNFQMLHSELFRNGDIKQ